MTYQSKVETVHRNSNKDPSEMPLVVPSSNSKDRSIISLWIYALWIDGLDWHIGRIMDFLVAVTTSIPGPT